MNPAHIVPDSKPSVLEAPNSTYLWTQLLIEELVRLGVDTFFVSPGSRSTPLTVAVARHPEAKVILHVDERGSAFAALGTGRATQRPVGWITTSGTAVANGLPAAVEAATDGVPMLLLTSDRPPEKRDTGANQTIDQVKLFGDHVRWQVDVPPPTGDVDPAYVLTTVDHAVHRATRVPPGPVHVNCMFRKPLEPLESAQSVSIPTAVRRWAEGSAAFTRYPRTTASPSDPEFDSLVKSLEGEPRGLIVAGRLDTDEEVEAVTRLAEHLHWPLIPDVTSRLRLGAAASDLRIPFGDLVLTSDRFRDRFAPEAVLQVGGRFVSKRLRLFLRESDPDIWAVVRPAPLRVDPDHRVTHHLEADVSATSDALRSRLDEREEGGEWVSPWRQGSEVAEEVVRSTAHTSGLSEPAVAAALSEEVPPGHALVAASSMPVRDLNRHAGTTGARVPVYANRGASGIDGTVSTAAGVAQGADGPVTLLIGDLALWHDLNGLALLDDRQVVVVVVNNNGGGIFHFLPIHEHDEVFDPYFTTPHGRSFEDAAATFDLSYSRPDTLKALQADYRAACRSGTSALIEVQTDRAKNRDAHDAIETTVQAAIDECLSL